MTTSLTPRPTPHPEGPGAPSVPTGRRRWTRLSPGWRKFVVLVHVVGALGWLGVTATFVVLTLALLDIGDPATLRVGYVGHELMVTWLARPAALLTLGTGLVLSFGTPWRLTRHWWVLAKLVLLVATVVVTVSVSPEVLRYAVDHAGEVGSPAYTDAQRTLVLMAFYHVVMISAAAALSVYKPGGRLRRPRPPGRTSRRSLRLLAATLGVVAVLTGGLTACAGPRADQVTGWISAHADPLRTVDPTAPLDDLAPLGRSIGDAQIVGLGESVHGTAEQTTLKHRTVRLLVERMGFRSIAWEEQWTTGLAVNEYLRTGDGDLSSLIAEMGPQWQSREVGDVLRWLHDFNVGRPDKVQFVGVEYYLTGPRAYDAVDAYVSATAPARVPELRGHLQAIRPRTADIYEHVQAYMGAADKEPFVRHARDVLALLEGLPHPPGDRDHALVLHHARQIVSFYEHFRMPDRDSLVYRDARAAENLRWWREYSGDRVIYWAASPHTAVAPQLRIAVPPAEDMAFPSAGSSLRRWYGRRYLSIGFTFDQGTVSLGQGQTADMTPPAPDWFERPFAAVGDDQFVLDLRTPAPPPARDWRDGPLRTRGLPDRGPASSMDGGSVAQWFDVIVHRQHVTPVRPA